MNRGRLRDAAHWIPRVMFASVVAVATLMLSDSSLASFEPIASIASTNNTPGAPTTLTFNFELRAPDVASMTVAFFIPPDFQLSDDAAVSDGAYAGSASAKGNLLAKDDSCSGSFTDMLPLMEATTDESSPVDFYTGTLDLNDNGLPDNVDRYPNFLQQLVPGEVPVQRYYGQMISKVAYSTIDVLIYAPGARIPLMPPLDLALGFPVLVGINNPLGPLFSAYSACTPQSLSLQLNGTTSDNRATTANEAGQIVLRNPEQDGYYGATIFARGLPDADGDGIENTLDRCPYTADTLWDPRIGGPRGDSDLDGLPDACDPNDAQANPDQDGDYTPNNYDSCPLVSQDFRDPGGDRDRDFIADDCDAFPDDATDGGMTVWPGLCITDVLQVGEASGDPPALPCPGGADLPLPPILYVDPSGGYAAAGSVLSLHVYLLDLLQGKSTSPGVTIHFDVVGANPAQGTCLTNNVGGCEFNYLGVLTGRDVIHLTASVDGFDLATTIMVEWDGPPINDDFAAAIEVQLPFEDERVMAAATTQTGEPHGCDSVGNTIWYKLTPHEDTHVRIEMAGSLEGPFFLPLVVVYAGSSLRNLALLGCSYTFGPPPFGVSSQGAFPDYPSQYVTFPAEAGETYYVQVSSDLFAQDAGKVRIVMEAFTLGDTNCSKSVDTLDALTILRDISGLSTGVDEKCLEYADINCDGVVDTTDALALLRMTAALSVSFSTFCSSLPGF